MSMQHLEYALAGMALLLTLGPAPALAQAETADLSVTDKADNPDPVSVGSDLGYVLFLRNNGPNDAAYVVSDTLPPSVIFVSAPTTCTYSGTGTGGVVRCSRVLRSQSNTVLFITVRPTVPGTIVNTVEITGAIPDPDPGNNTASETTTVNAGGGATCNGQPATITGTEGNDRLAGTAGADVIAALGGNDFVTGGGGNDLICGGDGNDQLRGVSGNDSLFGEADDDRLLGGAGFDALNGGEGDDRAQGDGDDDTVTGEAGNDTLLGNNGNDTLDGGADTDALDGGSNTAPGDTCANGETNVNCESVL